MYGILMTLTGDNMIITGAVVVVVLAAYLIYQMHKATDDHWFDEEDIYNGNI